MGSITDQNYLDFKKAYEKALAEGKEIFEFEGLDVLVTYAYYVLEYAEGLNKKENTK